MGPTSAIELTNDLQVLSGQMPASRAAVRVSFVPNFPVRSRGLPVSKSRGDRQHNLCPSCPCHELRALALNRGVENVRP